MFTSEQINAAHGKVKSGADFPAYIREIGTLGVTHYETFVADGHTDYHGADGYSLKVPPRFAPAEIAESLDRDAFKAGLSAHQQGKTDFPTFIGMCAQCGIEKWTIDLGEMGCTYFDRVGNEVWKEAIPQ